MNLSNPRVLSKASKYLTSIPVINQRPMATFETLKFDNLVLKTLPIDTVQENYVREVKNACFSRIKPTPLKNPTMVVYSKSAMGLLDLNSDELERKEAAEYLSGNKILPGSETAAHCYCGHQFGVFAGQLGDGAAIYLGEVLNRRNERWEIQLKGAGLTPYSRSADGRKVLRSSLREFLCSEAMHFLGVPTTRAGSCVVSESTVIRDMFYDGNPKLEKCAVILRIAPSFIRFGSFEICRPLDRNTGGKGPSFGRNDILTKLLDYICDNFYQEIISTEPNVDANTKYEKVFREIVRRTAKLVAEWQCCGFVHGVLNTDNMSILGLTIDYGPFGFLDRYDPEHIFNGSDTGGRYTYKNQIDICEWNCSMLAEALSPILEEKKLKKIVESEFKNEVEKCYLEKMSLKFGFQSREQSDKKLFEEFFEVMYQTGADFTNSFRKLSQLKLNGPDRLNADIQQYLDDLLLDCCSVDEFKAFNRPRMTKETLDKFVKAMETTPEILAYFGLSESFVRNQARLIEKYDQVKDLTAEDKKNNDSELWKSWLQKYMNRLYSEFGSESVDIKNEKRISVMNSVNPRFILRNHLAQAAIEKAENGDFNESKMLLKVLENPFSEKPLEEILNEFDKNDVEEKSRTNFYQKGPVLSKCVKLTCSS